MNDQLKVATRLLILVGLAMGLGCTTHSELPSTTVQPPSELAKIEQEVPKITKLDVTVPEPQKLINVLITGRITNKHVDFGGCPKVFAANIANKNGSKSHNSKTFIIQDRAVLQILGRSVKITADREVLNGFQVLTDENGFYSVCDKVDSDLKEASYKFVSYTHLQGRCNSDVFYIVGNLSGVTPVSVKLDSTTVKLTSDNLPMAHLPFPYVQVKRDKWFQHFEEFTREDKIGPDLKSSGKQGDFTMGASEEYKDYLRHFQNAKCP